MKYNVSKVGEVDYIPLEGVEPFSVTVSPAGNIFIWCRQPVTTPDKPVVSTKRKWHRVKHRAKKDIKAT